MRLEAPSLEDWSLIGGGGMFRFPLQCVLLSSGMGPDGWWQSARAVLRAAFDR